ncbi:MAG TPA: hypothetical protein VH105_21735 [Burkholderiales bacterium]|nr:hypothetical protein [Burkholderiales bacterium]
MPFTILMCGHGSWSPSDDFVRLPKGVSMDFMVHHAKLMPTDDTMDVCDGSYPRPPSWTVEPFQACPNMTWTCYDMAEKSESTRRFQQNQKDQPGAIRFANSYRTLVDMRTLSIKLSAYLAHMDNEFRVDADKYGGIRLVWNCCTSVNLRPSAAGGRSGFNAAQYLDQYTHMDMTKDNPTPVNFTRRDGHG